MKKATFKISGKKPFLYHKFNLDVLTNKKKPKDGSAGNSPSEWKETFWSDGKKLYIPDSYFFSTIVNGGKCVKVGRGTISKKIASCLEIVNEKHFIQNRKIPKVKKSLSNVDLSNDSKKDLYVDIRMVANPNTKGRNVRHRLAMSAGWRTECSIRWDDTVISKDEMELAVKESGSLVGIGDGRAIGFGRFEVSDFVVE